MIRRARRATWSADGRWLAFTSRKSLDDQGKPFLDNLELMRPDGTERHMLVSHEGSGDISFAWAPCGSRLAVFT